MQKNVNNMLAAKIVVLEESGGYRHLTQRIVIININKCQSIYFQKDVHNIIFNKKT